MTTFGESSWRSSFSTWLASWMISYLVLWSSWSWRYSDVHLVMLHSFCLIFESLLSSGIVCCICHSLFLFDYLCLICFLSFWYFCRLHPSSFCRRIIWRWEMKFEYQQSPGCCRSWWCLLVPDHSFASNLQSMTLRPSAIFVGFMARLTWYFGCHFLMNNQMSAISGELVQILFWWLHRWSFWIQNSLFLKANLLIYYQEMPQHFPSTITSLNWYPLTYFWFVLFL